MTEARDDEVPLVVVGAGPVGLIAALTARHEGIPVIVLEKDAEDDPRPGSRATFLFRESLDLLERVAPGVTRDLVAQSGQWTALRTTYRGDTIFAKKFPKSEPGSFGISLPQPRQEDTYRARCAQEGVEFRWSTTVVDAVSDPTGVTLTLDSGEKLRTRYVLAADGARSIMRSSFGGMEFEGERSKTAFIIVDAAATDENAPELSERAFHYNHPAVDGRNVLLVPFGGGLRIDLQCEPGDDVDWWQSPERLAAWVTAVAGASYAENILWASTYRFNRSVARSYTDPNRRVLLAGEAAHLFPPFGGGRGLNSGIPDAVFAVEAIAEALSATDPHRAWHVIDSVARERRMAGLANRDQASKALVRMEARTPLRRLQRLIAAKLAPWWKPFGVWLDRSPTGGSTQPVTSRSRF